MESELKIELRPDPFDPHYKEFLNNYCEYNINDTIENPRFFESCYNLYSAALYRKGHIGKWHFLLIYNT